MQLEEGTLFESGTQAQLHLSPPLTFAAWKQDTAVEHLLTDILHSMQFRLSYTLTLQHSCTMALKAVLTACKQYLMAYTSPTKLSAIAAEIYDQLYLGVFILNLAFR